LYACLLQAWRATEGVTPAVLPPPNRRCAGSTSVPLQSVHVVLRFFMSAGCIRKARRRRATEMKVEAEGVPGAATAAAYTARAWQKPDASERSREQSAARRYAKVVTAGQGCVCVWWPRRVVRRQRRLVRCRRTAAERSEAQHRAGTRCAEAVEECASPGSPPAPPRAASTGCYSSARAVGSMGTGSSMLPEAAAFSCPPPAGAAAGEAARRGGGARAQVC